MALRLPDGTQDGDGPFVAPAAADAQRAADGGGAGDAADAEIRGQSSPAVGPGCGG